MMSRNLSSDPGKPNKSSDNGGSLRQAGQALSLGTEIVFPSLLGWWLDRWFDSAPTGLIVGGVLGFILMFIHATRLIEPDRPRDEQNPQPPSESSENAQS